MPALGLAGPHVAIVLTHFLDQQLRGGTADIQKYRTASLLKDRDQLFSLVNKDRVRANGASVSTEGEFRLIIRKNFVTIRTVRTLETRYPGEEAKSPSLNGTQGKINSPFIKED